MHIISLIAAVDERGGIGKDNHLLCYLPADLQYFKAVTLGKPIVMGRRTFESIGKALPGRLNIVLSRSGLTLSGATVVSNLDEAFRLTADAREVVVIGGAHVFGQALPRAHRIYQTIIHAQFDSDVFFPEVNWGNWTLVESKNRPSDEKNAYEMTFNRYNRISFGRTEKTSELNKKSS